MNEQPTPLSLTEFTKILSRLTPAQQALFGQIGRHSAPITVPRLAEELGLHVSSVRETLEALIKADVVISERLPAKGRGRPAMGYSTRLPPHPMFVALTLKCFSRGVFSFLETLDEDTAMTAAYEIGVNWSHETIDVMGAECLDEIDALPADFDLEHFLKDTRTYLRRMGLGAMRDDDDPRTFILLTAPVVEPHDPNRFALETRRGMVEGFLDRRFGRFIEYSLTADPQNPLSLIFTVTPVTDAPDA